MKEISEIGFANYNRYTAQLTLSIFDIAKFLEEQKIGGNVPTPLHFIIDVWENNPIQFLELQLAFFTYIRKPIEISGDTIVVIGDSPDKNFILNESNFNEFQETILAINKMFDVEDEREINSPNEAMRQKFLKARMKLREAKKRAKEKDS